jgi:Transposase DDE domain
MPCNSALMQTRKRCAKRRETVEHPFGTMKARMGATHLLTKTLPKVAAEMALSVLAYNLVYLWPTGELAARFAEVCLAGYSRRELLGLSSSRFDPIADMQPALPLSVSRA